MLTRRTKVQRAAAAKAKLLMKRQAAQQAAVSPTANALSDDEDDPPANQEGTSMQMMQLELKFMRQQMEEMRMSLEVREKDFNQRERELKRREMKCLEEEERLITATGAGDVTGDMHQSVSSVPQASRFPFLRPTPFDGKSSMADFLERHESYFQSATSDKDKVLLVSQLLGSAWPNFRAWQRQTSTHTYADLKKFLIHRYDPLSGTLSAGIQLRQTTRESGETFQSFLNRIESLVLVAYPNEVYESYQRRVIEQFIYGLEDDYLREKLAMVKETNIEAILTAAKDYSQARMLGRRKTHTTSAVEALPMRVKREPTQAPQGYRGKSASSAWKPDPTRSCWNCGKIGHYSFMCKLPVNQQRVTTARNNFQASKLETTIPKSTINNLMQQSETNHSDSLLYVSANIGSRRSSKNVAMLIDSGASINVLSADIYDKLGSKYPLTKPSAQLLSVTDQHLQVRGVAMIPIRLGPICHVSPVYICEGIRQDGLLGLQFLRETGIVLDFASASMLVDGHIIPIRTSHRSPTVCHISLSEDFELTANSETNIPGATLSRPLEVIGIVEPRSVDKSINVLSTLEVPTLGKVNLRVVNQLDRAVTLSKGTKLGNFVPIQVRGCEIKELDEIESSKSISENNNSRVIDEIKSTELQGSERDTLDQLLQSFKDVFSTQLGRTDHVQHSIVTTGRPVKQPPRRTAPTEKQEIDNQIDSMLQRDVIRPSTSPWASPVVLVKKKSGDMRFCIDYRRLNAQTEKDSFPLPRVDDILDTLAGKKYFSGLDINSGYWQVEMQEQDAAKTAFITHRGLFQFNTMPFGLCNAAGTFQRLMTSILSGILGPNCMVYIDDIVICGNTLEQHNAILREVLLRLRSANLTVKAKKCNIGVKSLKVLGHVVSKKGISTDQDKVLSIKQWPVPTNFKEVQSFLGLTGYYRRFVKDYSDISKPLRELQKGEKFFFSTEALLAFQTLKARLSNAPVMTEMKAQEEEIILDTDASNFSIGAVLSVKRDNLEHVVAYGSKSLSKAEQNYSVTKRELLACVFFMKKFRAYLYGRHFKLRVDHHSLTHLLNFKEPRNQLARWLESVQEFDFDIVFRAGSKHLNADALSRIPPDIQKDMYEPPTVNMARVKQSMRDVRQDSEEETEPVATQVQINQEAPPLAIRRVLPGLDEFRVLQQADSDIAPILIAIEKGMLHLTSQEKDRLTSFGRTLWQKREQLVLRTGVLYLATRVVVPQRIVRDIILSVHRSAAGGHMGVEKTLEKLKNNFYWSKMRQGIQLELWSCLECQQAKPPSAYGKESLQTIGVGFPGQRVGLDVIEFGKTKSQNRYGLTMIDYFTKWAEVIPIRNERASTIAKVFFDEWVCRFGVPHTIHHDQGRNFESKLLGKLCELLDADQTRTSPYRPQCNGLTERIHRTLNEMLRCVLSADDEWDEKLPSCLLAYRSSVQTTTGFTPHYMTTGREMILPLDLVYGQRPEEHGYEMISKIHRDIAHAYDVARDRMKLQQARQKRYYDSKCKRKQIRVGQLVMVLIPPTSQDRQSRKPKLRVKWYGPVPIIKVCGQLVEIQSTKRASGTILVHKDRIKLFKGHLDTVARYDASDESN